MATLSKNSHLKDFSSVLLFCHKNQKNLLQREIKDCTFKTYLLTADTSSWFPLIESLKITCARSYAWFLNFYWIVFRKISYPNLSNCDLSKVPKRKQIESILILPKVSKMNINFELLKVSKMTSLKIYISSVMEKLETSNLDSR